MKNKDERMKIMSEVLSGIKVSSRVWAPWKMGIPVRPAPAHSGYFTDLEAFCLGALI